MAFADALHREPPANDQSAGSDGVNRVLRTGRIKATTGRLPEERRLQWRQRHLVKAKAEQDRPRREPRGQMEKCGPGHFPERSTSPPTRWQALRNLRSVSANRSSGRDRRATRTRSLCAGSLSWWMRKTSRSRRLAIFRRTAFPTLREAITPNRRIGSPSPVRNRMENRKVPQSTRRPFCRTASNSAVRRRRCLEEKRMARAEMAAGSDGGGKTLAALAATRVDDGAATAGGHAGTEPEFAGSLQLGRSVGRLHVVLISG